MVTTAELHDIAKKAERIFARYGVACCLTGGVACGLYGTTRPANDVDLVVLTTAHQQEELKRILVAADPQFYLVASKDPYATYRVLWYRLGSAYSRYAARCKVDLLVPGIMNIPDVPKKYIETLGGLPAMPFMLLLWMKLQARTDHRGSPKPYMRPKQWDDVRDIDQLLDIARRRGEMIRAKTAWMPASFVDAALARIREYIADFPASKAKWEGIGYGGRRSTSRLVGVL
ncbi:uncharacterized protein B0H18DRAFT_879935 [Fomitopsis serialis]|uniref:uncharacterized protein n=1 Tax=Fomitopsis serialis TaxID=139415 RepID=UPI0020073986|nr:uncharacterized protein B0H18DRAFT_881819 [Neoantrodia serialis]XP_047891013.1 uncharacterized protein B0H18DRAFT_879935 [Neoantrodia serialis]KAH9919564.1 hypothetical protein B0H18DRAFT_881819 [Neoantrodia serialis]KAH9921826.1 hypothetical protein B0H18DRAFT_879935 [Neoantrodia serialis]